MKRIELKDRPTQNRHPLWELEIISPYYKGKGTIEMIFRNSDLGKYSFINFIYGAIHYGMDTLTDKTRWE
jgi:hypothetical protein